MTKTKQPPPPNQQQQQQPTHQKLISSIISWPFRFLRTIPSVNLILTILLISSIYLITISFNHFLSNKLINPISSLLTHLISSPSLLIYFYCTTLNGPFCNTTNDEHQNVQELAQIARTVTGTAQKASDIFDSVVQLSDPNQLGVHQTEILELSFAIRWSSELVDKQLLSHSLAELADLSRDLKDRLVELNAQGLNTFSFIAYEFSRLGDLMYWVQSGQKKYTSQTIAKNLDILFSHLSSELTRLLNAIQNLIPLASRSTNLGIQVSERLHQEHYQLVNKKTQQTLWKKLLDLTSFSGQQLNHDLTLTSESIKNLRLTWIKLEQIRTDLLTYRNNVAHFKASFTGWHLADHQLSPEDELFSMREVIDRFQLTINEVKSTSRLPYSSSPSTTRSLSDTKPTST